MDKYSSRSEVLRAVAKDGNNLRLAHPDLKNDYEIVMTAVKNNYDALFYASKELKDNKEIVKAAIKKNRSSFKYASDRLKDDKELAMMALPGYGVYKELSSRLKIDRDIILKAAQSDIEYIIKENPELLSDLEFARSAVEMKGLNLKYLDKSVRNDEEVVSLAVKNDHKAFEYASERIKTNKEVIIKLIKSNVEVYMILEDYLKKDNLIMDTYLEQEKRQWMYIDNYPKDKTFYIKALQKGLQIYGRLDNQFKTDKDIIIAASESEQVEYCNLSEEHKNNEEIALHVIHKDEDLLCAPIKIKNNPRIISNMIKNNKNKGKLLQYVGEEIKKNREIIELLIESEGYDTYKNFAFMDESFINDIDISLKIIKNQINAMEYIDQSLLNNQDFIQMAILIDPYALSFASDKIRKNRDFMKEAIKQNNHCLQYIHQELLCDQAFIKAILPFLHDYSVLKHISNDVKQDQDILQLLLVFDAKQIEFASEETKDNEEIVRNAIVKSADIMEFVSDRLKHNRSLVIEALRAIPGRHDIDFDYFADDREIMEIKIENSGYYLSKASARLRNDKELVFKALKNDAEVYQYIGDELKRDRDLAKYALEKRNFNIIYLDNSYYEKFEWLLSLIVDHPNLLKWFPDYRYKPTIRKSLIEAFTNNYEKIINKSRFGAFTFDTVLQGSIYLIQCKRKISIPQLGVFKIKNIADKTNQVPKYLRQKDYFEDHSCATFKIIDSFEREIKDLFVDFSDLTYDDYWKLENSMEIIDQIHEGDDLYLLIENDMPNISFYNKIQTNLYEDLYETISKKGIKKNAKTNRNETTSTVSFNTGLLVSVEFNNRSYEYNSKLDVKVGDQVKVSGKLKGEIGTVKQIIGYWDDSDYMQEIVKVIHSNDKHISSNNTIDEIAVEKPNWYDYMNIQSKKTLHDKRDDLIKLTKNFKDIIDQLYSSSTDDEKKQVFMELIALLIIKNISIDENIADEELNFCLEVNKVLNSGFLESSSMIKFTSQQSDLHENFKEFILVDPTCNYGVYWIELGELCELNNISFNELIDIYIKIVIMTSLLDGELHLNELSLIETIMSNLITYYQS